MTILQAFFACNTDNIPVPEELEDDADSYYSNSYLCHWSIFY